MRLSERAVLKYNSSYIRGGPGRPRPTRSARQFPIGRAPLSERAVLEYNSSYIRGGPGRPCPTDLTFW